MSALSIFIDESGEFGTNSEYYLLTLVFHDQRQSVTSQVKRLDSLLEMAGLPNEKPIHTAPLIRKEESYFHLDLSARRQLFDKLFTFTRTVGIKYKTFVYRKREFSENYLLVNRIARDLASFLRDNLVYFQAFDNIITYYDGGQSEITQIIGVVFSASLFEVDYRKVKPIDYRLFQAADLLCYMELLTIKDEDKKLTKSKTLFFESRRRLIRTYLKAAWKLRFK
ncbi:MAG: DUF3800 domain-containing protein [Coriobacteriia bacterium]|nr:DUF3800 domain-containing protein [Coriobacteriia bacterium]